ncbi:flagellar biosynthetic protein FliO [Ramlibacter sp. 2FC]|uniref:FliO/MopB family protein n=1 Tax=Ramlibacter sp. 2FC TaxID=2502188 RepID=UPI0010F66357|nr:flagellar biosynthetic protein FliO [Ramlibacter sp. 2FC]
MPSSASFALWSLLIVALVPLTLWLLRRAGVARAGQSEVTRVVSSTTLGPGQRLVTVEVGQGDERRWLVLGVTAQQIQAVHSLSAPPPAGPAGEVADASGASFAELVHKLSHGWAPKQPGGAR